MMNLAYCHTVNRNNLPRIKIDTSNDHRSMDLEKWMPATENYVPGDNLMSELEGSKCGMRVRSTGRANRTTDGNQAK